MQLPDFVKRATAFFDKAEANQVAVAELDKAKARIVTLETENGKHLATIGERDATIKELQGKLEASEKKSANLETEKAGLKAKVDQETKRTDTTLANMGVDPKSIPGTPAKDAPKANVWDQLNALSGEERRRFRLEHWQELRNTEPPTK